MSKCDVMNKMAAKPQYRRLSHGTGLPFYCPPELATILQYTTIQINK